MAAGKYKRIPNKGRLCSITDCTTDSYCRGLCKKHYEYTRPRKVCSEPDCGKPMVARGLCSAHYCRWKNHGTTARHPRFTPKQCSVVGCGGKAKRKGLCGKCSQRKCYVPSPRTRARCLFIGPPKPRSWHHVGPMCAEPGCIARTSRSRIKYCKDHKQSAWKIKPHARRCLHCGSEFIAVRGIFCGGNCSRRHKQGLLAIRQCQVCGNDFPFKDTWKVCSKECDRKRRLASYRKSAAKRRTTKEGKKAHLKANKKYIERNRDKVNGYLRRRRVIDPAFRMAQLARSMLQHVLKRLNKRKDSRCFKILGYNGAQLKAHIERQFSHGMTWDRFGKEIHVDHIIPVAEWLRRGETRPEVINALSNLRPMWAMDNIKKSDTVHTLV